MSKDSDSLEKSVGFRVSVEEYNAAAALARVHKMSMTEYLRGRIDFPAVIEEARRVRREIARAS